MAIMTGGEAVLQMLKAEGTQVFFGVPPAFARLAEAFGAEGIRLDRHEDLPAVLSQVLTRHKVSVLDMPRWQ